MRIIKRWSRRLEVLTRRDAVERDLDEELAFHIEMQTEENIRRGMSESEARRQAVIAFGPTERHREEVREARWFGRLAALSPDLKLALRMLAKHPALSIIGVLGMAMAIAIASTVFTFMTSFYYSVPPLEEGRRLVGLENDNILTEDDWKATLFDYHAWKAELRSFQELAAFRSADRAIEIPGGTSAQAEVAEMTASGFRAARVPPLLGRPLLDADEVDGSPPVVVIGQAEWERDFGADPNVVGRQVRLEGLPYTVVGVMPEHFRFPVNHGYWTALRTDPSLFGPGEGPKTFVFGRLADGISAEAAQEELAAVGRQLSAEHPGVYGNLRPAVLPYIHPIMDMQPYPAWSMWLLQLLGAFVLTVIAINVAVLVYARTATRMAELTVRTALGAGRRRIVTQLFIEALALSSLAALLGLVLAQIAYKQLWSLSGAEVNLPYWIPDGLTVTSVLYSAGLALFAATFIGIIPALKATGPHLQHSLRQMGGSTGIRIGKTWTALIVIQVAIAVAVLPVIVGVTWRSVAPVRADPLFAAESLLSFRVAPDAAAVSPSRSPESVEEVGAGEFAEAQSRVIENVRRRPEVEAVTFANAYPRSALEMRVEVEGLDVSDNASTLVRWGKVDLNYFDVFGIEQLAGRGFQPEDLSDASNAVIVNRSFVDRVLAGGPAVGRLVRASTPDGEETGSWLQIVGVVDDLYRPTDPETNEAEIYRALPLGPEPVTVTVRLRGGTTPVSFAPTVRTLTGEVAPGHLSTGIPVADLYTGGGRATFIFLGLVIGLITLSVLLLSAAGIASLMSFAVTRRQREVGIRTALGAPRTKVIVAIFSESTRQLALGLMIGAVACAALDRLTGGSLLGARPLMLVAMVAGMMVVAGLLATLGPARRALRIQPMDALRQE